MREEVKKCLFVGAAEDKELFFKTAQEGGVIHFIDPNQKTNKDVPQKVHRLTSAIRILRGQPIAEQEENFQGLDSDALVSAILSLSEQGEKLQEELRALTMEIARVEVFGNFSFDDIAYIEKKGKCAIQFFCARPHLFGEIEEPEGLIFIASEHGLDYYVAINEQPVSYEKMAEIKFDSPVGSLMQKRKKVHQESHRIELELKALAKYNDYLHNALVDTLNEYHLYHAQTYVQATMDGKLFAVEGWVPATKIADVSRMIENKPIVMEEVAIEPADVVPTYLENSGFARLGEDLVHIYDTPSYTDKDPSMWVLGGFALFFAFIIGDAGYGLIYLMLALFVRYRYPNLKGTGKRVLNLFTLLCVGCIAWGTLMTSFFGMQIGIDNPIRKFSLVQWLAEKKAEYHLLNYDAVAREWIAKYPELKNVKDPHTFVSFSNDPSEGPIILNKLTDNVMFELALFIGVLHLVLSLLRYAARNWQNTGWIAFLIGAYLYFPSYLQTPSLFNYVAGIEIEKAGAFGFQLMCVGIGAAWLLAIIRHGWTGIFEVMVLIQVFADTLSYLRLYALGLAGAIVASTINQIASGMPLILGVVLIVVSHSINIVLSTMSGIIHGLRLNFLEWYHYSFEGGGRQFQPLRLLRKD